MTDRTPLTVEDERAAIVALREENARLRGMLAAIGSIINLAPAISRAELDPILVADAAKLGLRETARRHGVGVGMVRGAVARASSEGSR